MPGLATGPVVAWWGSRRFFVRRRGQCRVWWMDTGFGQIQCRLRLDDFVLRERGQERQGKGVLWRALIGRKVAADPARCAPNPARQGSDRQALSWAVKKTAPEPSPVVSPSRLLLHFWKSTPGIGNSVADPGRPGASQPGMSSLLPCLGVYPSDCPGVASGRTAFIAQLFRRAGSRWFISGAVMVPAIVLAFRFRRGGCWPSTGIGHLPRRSPRFRRLVIRCFEDAFYDQLIAGIVAMVAALRHLGQWRWRLASGFRGDAAHATSFAILKAFVLGWVNGTHDCQQRQPCLQYTRRSQISRPRALGR